MGHYTYPIPVVRLIIPDKHHRALILRRADTEYGFDAWCLPGGKIDYCETVAAACKRELHEETGLTLINSIFLFYQDSLPQSDGKMHCINFYFKCSVEGNLSINNESSQIAWIGPDELPQYQIVFRNDEGLRKYWQSSPSG